jgi:hypothetical protein
MNPSEIALKKLKTMDFKNLTIRLKADVFMYLPCFQNR